MNALTATATVLTTHASPSLIDAATGNVSEDRAILALQAGKSALRAEGQSKRDWANFWESSGIELMSNLIELSRFAESLGTAALESLKIACHRASQKGFENHPSFGPHGGRVTVALKYDDKKRPIGVNWNKGVTLERFTEEKAAIKKASDQAKALVQRETSAQHADERAKQLAARAASDYEALKADFRALQEKYAEQAEELETLKRDNRVMRDELDYFHKIAGARAKAKAKAK